MGVSQYKDSRCDLTGIYSILNTLNGKMYIGGAYRRFKNRWWAHIEELNGNKHGNKHLQGAWNKYGQEHFLFNIIEVVEGKENIEKRETFWIQLLWPTGMLYNKTKQAGTVLGMVHSQETKDRLSAIKKIQSNLPDIKARTIASLKEYWTDEKREEQSERAKKQLDEDPTRLEKWVKAGQAGFREFRTKQGYRYTGFFDKPYRLANIDNVIFEGDSLARFCEDQKLKIQHVDDVLIGKREHYKGWHLPETDIKIRISKTSRSIPFGYRHKIKKLDRLDKLGQGEIVDYTGKIYYFDNLNDFCRERGLNRIYIYLVMVGKRKHFGGWHLSTTEIKFRTMYNRKFDRILFYVVD